MSERFSPLRTEPMWRVENLATLDVGPDGRVTGASARARALIGPSFAAGRPLAHWLRCDDATCEALVSGPGGWSGPAGLLRGEALPLEVDAVSLVEAGQRRVLLLARPETLLASQEQLGQINSQLVNLSRERAKAHAALNAAHRTLEAQAEEIQAQNEEIQAQNEELATQRADLARLAEDLQARNKALAAQEARHRLLVENIQEHAIFMVDADGRIASWSAGCEAMFGLSFAEAIGEPLARLLPPEEAGIDFLASALSEGFSRTEGWRAGAGDRRIWMEQVITPLRVGDRLEGYSIIMRDLTHRRAHEAQRAEYEALQRTDRLKDEFLGILSHELRTPINAIMGFGSILQDELVGPLSAHQHDYMKQLLGGADHLVGIVDDLLDMSRLQAGRLLVTTEPTDIAELAAAVLAAHADALAAKGLTARCELGALPLVEAEPPRLARVLTKLLDNAIKFTPHGGHITLRARVEGAMLRCELEDSGPGVAPEARERVFQPFTQQDMASTRQHGGMGIGLALSRALIEAQGGELGLARGAGQGACFYFTLPLAQPGVAS